MGRTELEELQREASESRRRADALEESLQPSESSLAWQQDYNALVLKQRVREELEKKTRFEELERREKARIEQQRRSALARELAHIRTQFRKSKSVQSLGPTPIYRCFMPFGRTLDIFRIPKLDLMFTLGSHGFLGVWKEGQLQTPAQVIIDEASSQATENTSAEDAASNKPATQGTSNRKSKAIPAQIPAPTLVDYADITRDIYVSDSEDVISAACVCMDPQTGNIPSAIIDIINEMESERALQRSEARSNQTGDDTPNNGSDKDIGLVPTGEVATTVSKSRETRGASSETASSSVTSSKRKGKSSNTKQQQQQQQQQQQSGKGASSPRKGGNTSTRNTSAKNSSTSTHKKNVELSAIPSASSSIRSDPIKVLLFAMSRTGRGYLTLCYIAALPRLTANPDTLTEEDMSNFRLLSQLFEKDPAAAIRKMKINLEDEGVRWIHSSETLLDRPMTRVPFSSVAYSDATATIIGCAQNVVRGFDVNLRCVWTCQLDVLLRIPKETKPDREKDRSPALGSPSNNNNNNNINSVNGTDAPSITAAGVLPSLSTAISSTSQFGADVSNNLRMSMSINNGDRGGTLQMGLGNMPATSPTSPGSPGALDDDEAAVSCMSPLDDFGRAYLIGLPDGHVVLMELSKDTTQPPFEPGSPTNATSPIGGSNSPSTLVHNNSKYAESIRSMSILGGASTNPAKTWFDIATMRAKRLRQRNGTSATYSAGTGMDLNVAETRSSGLFSADDFAVDLAGRLATTPQGAKLMILAKANSPATCVHMSADRAIVVGCQDGGILHLTTDFQDDVSYFADTGPSPVRALGSSLQNHIVSCDDAGVLRVFTNRQLRGQTRSACISQPLHICSPSPDRNLEEETNITLLARDSFTTWRLLN